MAQLNLTTRNAAVFLLLLFTFVFLALALGSSFFLQLHDQQARLWEYFGGTFTSTMLILKVDGVQQKKPDTSDVEEK